MRGQTFANSVSNREFLGFCQEYFLSSFIIPDFQLFPEMPKRELAPRVGEISPTEHKSRKRRIKRLVQLRLGFGKSAFFDTHTHEPRYPVDEIAPALEKCESKAIKHGLHLDFSTEERQLWLQMFKIIWIAFGFCLILNLDWDKDGNPDIIQALRHLLNPNPDQVEKRDRTPSPDFIEKALGLEDDAIEKSLGLPDHSIEQFIDPDGQNRDG